jgi:hypothetical protein
MSDDWTMVVRSLYLNIVQYCMWAINVTRIKKDANNTVQPISAGKAGAKAGKIVPHAHQEI